MVNNKNPTIRDATKALNKIIAKSRIHMYKPIQIAEILHRDRIHKDISLTKLESYRIDSKKWRDDVTQILVGNISTSSAKFQDNLFDDNALPPKLISILGAKNRKTKGKMEEYIYAKFNAKFSGLNSVLNYVSNTNFRDFALKNFLDKFEKQAGLKRSLDKLYEIIVYALFKILIEALEVDIKISAKNPQSPVFFEFSEFSKKIFGSDFPNIKKNYSAKLFRVGVTNAADRGLDMWGNFGLAIQIKHLSISKETAENIVGAISADRIVIVCKDAEKKVICSLLSQIGWRGRIHSLVTFDELNDWYDKAMRGEFSDLLGEKILGALKEQIKVEFPATAGNPDVSSFFQKRGYFQ